MFNGIVTYEATQAGCVWRLVSFTIWEMNDLFRSLPLFVRFSFFTSFLTSEAVAQLIEALCYKPKSRGFDPDEVIGFSNWPNPSSRTMALGSTQPLTEMSTRNFPGGKWRTARKADNLTSICKTVVWKNVRASTSHNPMGLHGLLQG
jgi:hypothetical protein